MFLYFAVLINALIPTFKYDGLSRLNDGQNTRILLLELSPSKILKS
jgi:hypothetical protein